ncbi:hypothetical protein [Actinokineospora enzanensis]|uniref:hypothetical protein n=1 Tax=Actinokineospora enzanensis TaxID=155975 RepID=UPI00037A217C|nr:hypothetical protein [Actinokineospora enzanensis]
MTTTRVAAAAAGLFGVLGLFQAALALGVPWGRAAWGGSAAELPTGLRIASGVAVLLFALAVVTVLRAGGHPVWTPLSDTWARRVVWFFAVYCVLGTVANAISRSAVERAVWTPVCLVLAVLTFIVARSARPRVT